MDKPRQGWAGLWNISFGFFGIQIGFALQNANMSRVFQSLGSSMDDLPVLWVAAPLTGLLVQPIVGHLSDRTWLGRLGRRRPYFLAGAVLAAASLLLMPISGGLLTAALLLWMLDASLNMATEPFRAFAGDMLPRDQHVAGYAAQTAFIGAGAVVGSLFPYALDHFGIANTAAPGVVPDTVRYSFWAGGLALFAAVAWTVLTTREYSPHDLAAFADAGAQADAGPGPSMLGGFVGAIADMPPLMKRLAVVQFFSWSALFIMWIYTTPVVAQYHFGSADPASAAYQQAANWVGVLFSVYNGVAAVAALLVLPALAARFGKAHTHALCLVVGAAGFGGFAVVHDPAVLLLCEVGIGLAWASILAMPYAMLANALPQARLGVTMGLFNVFVVLPQLLVATVMGSIMKTFFPGEPIWTMAFAAVTLILAAVAAMRIEARIPIAIDPQ